MGVCCVGPTHKPKITFGREQDKKRYFAFVGSSLLDGYTSMKELIVDAKIQQDQQVQFQCGHIIRVGAYSNFNPELWYQAERRRNSSSVPY